MTCYYPLDAYRSKKNDGNIVFNTKLGYIHSLFHVPCGQCHGCRLERSRIWAIRCMHELQMHKMQDCHFLNLTINDENIPKNASLDKTQLQKFWKRLRKDGKNFRYYACGEYGDETHRPHYHAIVYGLHLKDKTAFKKTKQGYILHRSDYLDKKWSHGYINIGQVTFESCAYVSRYIMKKRLGPNSKNDYQIISKETGEILGELEPEFTNMSRNPGIGSDWYNQYKEDIYKEGNDGSATIRGGIRTTSPKFYDEKFEKENPERMQQIKLNRKEVAHTRRFDNTRERLITREIIALKTINHKLPRNIH